MHRSMKRCGEKISVFTVVGEQPYKNRDMVGSDSGLGHLLVIISKEFKALLCPGGLLRNIRVS